MHPTLRPALWLALLVPAALLGGAYASQYIGGLVPCEMCWWQRYPHFAALVVALLALVAPGVSLKQLLVTLAGLAIAVSGAIGVYHAGVEYHWWQGHTACTSTIRAVGVQATLDQIMNAPIVRCDAAQWTLFGVSLAGFNALFSFAGAIAIWVLAWRKA